jgi:Icc-related predicted phosphoesterase
MARRVTRVLCAADPRGSADALEALGAAAEDHDVQAICVVGDLGADGDRGEGYRTVFRALGGLGLPAFWVPGRDDAPVAEYLREAHNTEVVHPFLHGIHGTAAFADGHLLFAGFGGEVSDDPDGPRDEVDRLLYPRWEPEYRLKIIRELDEHQLAMAFSTPPAHKGLGRPGSDALFELIGTYRPRLVVAGGERMTERIGRTLVVAPGSLDDGHVTIADVLSREAEDVPLARSAVANR